MRSPVHWLESLVRSVLQRLKKRRAEPPPVEAEYLRLIYRNLAVSTPIALALVAYLAARVDPVSVPNARPWASVFGGFLVVRWIICMCYPRQREPNLLELRWWSILSVLLQSTSSLLLAALALFVLPSLDIYAQLSVFMVVMILSSAMAFSVSGRWIDTLVFAPPIYLSFAWAVARHSHPFAYWVALLVLGLFVLHLFNANAHRNSIRRGFEAARRNADLARELQLKNNEFQEVASARSRLLATVSHDLRQPAHAIGLLSERALGDMSFASVKETLRDLNELSQSLGASLVTLMDLTRLDAGLVQPRIGPVSLAQVLGRLDSEFAASARAKGLELAVSRSDCWVWSDPVLLNVVLTNLVSNAIKYTHHGRINVHVGDQGGFVQVRVVDTGVGIRADKLELIFKEFVRLDAADAGTEGLGLGLSIVRRYANLLSHQLSVKSQPGEGSSFTIDLPRAEPPPQVLELMAVAESAASEAAVKREDSDGLRGLNVLVIDNVELLLVSMTRTLSSWGCEVRSAHSLAEALQSAALQCPDLLVTDFHLGDREPNGVELIKGLRQQAQRNGRPHLPALLMTGDVSAPLEAQASEVGVQILHKPVRPKVLRATLSELVSRSASHHPVEN